MGRIVVPKSLRDRFALAPGHELEVVIEADGFRLRPARTAPVLARKKGLLVCDSEVPPAAWDLADFLERERAQRSREIGVTSAYHPTKVFFGLLRTMDV